VDVHLPESSRWRSCARRTRTRRCARSTGRWRWRQPGVAGVVDMMMGATTLRYRRAGDRGARGGRRAHGEGGVDPGGGRVRDLAGGDRDGGGAGSGGAGGVSDDERPQGRDQSQRGAAAAGGLGRQPARAVQAVLTQRGAGAPGDQVAAVGGAIGAPGRGDIFDADAVSHVPRAARVRGGLEGRGVDGAPLDAGGHAVAEDIAKRWRLKESQVRVLAQHVGGGFGSKATLCPEVSRRSS
jgi:hypothetical protein